MSSRGNGILSPGKRMRSYQTVHCKKREAIRLMNQIVAEKNAGTYFKASHLLLRDWLEQWYRDYCTGHLEKTTLASYRDKIDHYINPVLGNIPLGKLTGQDVQQWVNQIARKSPASGNPISPKSVRNVLLVLRPALDRAVDLHLIKENPATRVVLPKRERYHPKVYADADIRKMLTAAHGTDLYFPLMLALFTGMRRGELIALRWQDVDFQGKKLYVRHSIVSVQGVPEMKGPKTESGKREIALSDRILELLDEQRKSFPRSEYVVCQKNGQPFTPDAFSRKFQRFLSPKPSSAPPAARPSTRVGDIDDRTRRRHQDRPEQAGPQRYQHNPQHLFPYDRADEPQCGG